MDAGELFKILLVLLIVIAPAIGQIVAKVRESQKPPAGPARAPRAPQAPRPGEESFKEEIEEFLRRAAEGRQAARSPAQAGSAQASPAAQRAQPPAPAKTGAAPKLGRSKPAPQPVPAGPVRGTVVEHVQKHLDTSEFSRRTTELGGEVAQADDKLDARVHEVFEHQLSQFDWRTPQELEAAGETGQPSAAAGLFALLAAPESLRQAIVLNEVLQRPEQRWG